MGRRVVLTGLRGPQQLLDNYASKKPCAPAARELNKPTSSLVI
jgi:hypothetical protein